MRGLRKSHLRIQDEHERLYSTVENKDKRPEGESKTASRTRRRCCIGYAKKKKQNIFHLALHYFQNYWLKPSKMFGFATTFF
jgi:hypothetical protein